MSVDKLSFNESREEFTKWMQDFEERLQKATQVNPNADVEAISSDYSRFKELVFKSLGSLHHQVGLLAQQVDKQEMRSRRKILLLHGVPEKKQEDTASVVANVVVGQLKMAEFSAVDISRCHRMGRPVTGEKSRPILVKLRDVVPRDKIWFAKTNLKGSTTSISEFLTKPRHDAFMAARQRFGVKQCWTRDGFIHILGPDGSRHRICSLDELEKIAMPPPPPPGASKAATAAVKASTSKVRRVATSKK